MHLLGNVQFPSAPAASNTQKLPMIYHHLGQTWSSAQQPCAMHRRSAQHGSLAARLQTVHKLIGGL